MEYKYIYFLMEDLSGGIIVEKIMQKYKKEQEVDYKIKSFKGMGGIPQKISKASQAKTKQLLSSLPNYLKGFDKALAHMEGKKAVFVILDSDDNDCVKLKEDLVKMYQELNISLQVYFCIAIEEMEAWLLGDKKALVRAYPDARLNILQKYMQDSVIGTWECLADVVHKQGAKHFDKKVYHEIGKFKCECAEKIGEYLDIRNNKSPSFNFFIKKLDQFCRIV